MRILFLHGSFPGPFRLLAHSFGTEQENTVLFLSETGQKGGLPGVRRLRLAPPLSHAGDDPAEREAVLRFRRGARAGNAMLGLRKDGFAPDLVCASSSAGGSLYVRDIFPEAFYLVRADWFYNQGESHCFFNRGRPRPPADFAPARVRNLWEYNALGDADLAVISSEWQRSQYPEFLAQGLRVLHSGVDTAFFSPAPVAGFAGGGLDLADAGELFPARCTTRHVVSRSLCVVCRVCWNCVPPATCWWPGPRRGTTAAVPARKPGGARRKPCAGAARICRFRPRPAPVCICWGRAR